MAVTTTTTTTTKTATVAATGTFMTTTTATTTMTANMITATTTPTNITSLLLLINEHRCNNLAGYKSTLLYLNKQSSLARVITGSSERNSAHVHVIFTC